MLKSVSKGTLKGKKRDKIKQSPLPNGADNSYGVTRPFLLCHLEGEEVTASRLRPVTPLCSRFRTTFSKCFL